MSINRTMVALMTGLGVVAGFDIPEGAIAGEDPPPPNLTQQLTMPPATGAGPTAVPPIAVASAPNIFQAPHGGDTGAPANTDHSSVRGIPLNNLPADFWNWNSAEQTKWLQKRLSVVTLLEKVREKEDKIAPVKRLEQVREDKTSLIPPTIAGPTSSTVSAASTADLPEVERVYERNGKRTADIRVGNLPARPFVVGSRLPNGLVVSEIGKDDVAVVQAPRKVTLPSAGNSITALRSGSAAEDGASPEAITLPAAATQATALGAPLSATAAALAALPGALHAQPPGAGARSP